MMQRLRDEKDSADPALAGLARLVEAVGPTPPSPARKARVRRALATPGHRRTRAPRLVWAIAGAVVLVGSVALAGPSLYRWRESVRREAARRVDAAGVPRPGARPRARRVATAPQAPATNPASMPAPASQLSLPAPASQPPTAAAPLGPGVTPRATPGSPRVSRRSGSTPASGPVVAAGADAEPDAALVLTAIAALRRDHDAGRAASLLDRYLTRHPDGVLAEHALALAVEAEVARGNTLRANALARRYLARYPAGKFATAAKRVLANPGAER